MNFPLLFTVLGPAIGIIGWALQFNWLFWLGTAICILNLFLNMASGLMKLPVLPALFMMVAAFFVKPWHIGIGAGLLVWTALESMGELWMWGRGIRG